MNDDSPSLLRDEQGLRLIHAFLRIGDQAARNKVIEMAERLAEETAALARNASAPNGRELPSDITS
ncbi:hypothetical protein AYJ54_19455 [Bradyrhizobium centrolobii]|uniref:Uncharacterized protein n=1 Tax=Bradyrhizobium centrolobii TaxID=1505087 RepID=A0A176YJ31_9BRAD|nr:hypothetical protein [Bradyrhizobium centrolobii]OAF06697.1 hypothetical protein AYJ54_19455 [Bradyrhizobium centrolobii]